MAQQDKAADERVIATGDLGSGQRTIGGILAQFDAVGVDKAAAVQILSEAGLPAVAFDDPTFPISLQQDFEILNEIRKRLPDNRSIDVHLFWSMLGTRVNMFGPLGMVWQSAPRVIDAVEVLISYPQANWGRCRMIVFSSPTEERIEYHLDKTLIPLGSAQERDETYRYALMLEVSAAAAASLDIVSDRSLVKEIHLPFSQPADWANVVDALEVDVVFDAPKAAIVFKPGYLHDVPRRSHEVSFRIAVKIAGKESALLAEDTSFRSRVVRWLWTSSPPLKKAEIAKLLGVSERSLTRQLAAEDTTYNALFAEVQSERACNLLGNPKLTISEVAYRMGYSDPAAFTRAFTGWQGVTPSAWRQG